MYTMRMFMTFFKEFTTQSNTAFNFGTRFIVFKGLSTLNTLNDLIVDKLLAPALFLRPLKQRRATLVFCASLLDHLNNI